MAIEGVLDFLLGWMLNLPVWLALIVFGAFIGAVFALAQKYLTDQERMRTLKERGKKAQKELKKHRDDPKKMQKIQAAAMQDNMELMKMSFRPTMFLIIPIIFLFAWMNVHYSYELVAPGEPVQVQAFLERPAHVTLDANLSIEGAARKETSEGEVFWTVSADDPGRYPLLFSTDENETVSHTLIVGEQPRGSFNLLFWQTPGDAMVEQPRPFRRTEVEYAKLTPLGDFSIFGYMPGWLMFYFLVTIIIGQGIRKALRIH